MNSISDILEAIINSMSRIQEELGPSWNVFCTELTAEVENYISLTDPNKLNEVSELLWDMCCQYPVAKKILLQYLKSKYRSHEEKKYNNVTIFKIRKRLHTLIGTLKNLNHAEDTPTQNKVNETENIRFTMFHPKEAVAGEWYTTLIYTHLESMLEVVRSNAGKFVDEMRHDVREVNNNKVTKLVRGTKIKIIPSASHGVEFNPSTYTLTWNEDIERTSFRFRADPCVTNKHFKGEINIYVESLQVACIQFSVFVTDTTLVNETRVKPEMDESGTKMYQQIFISYSHRDTNIVKSCSKAFKSIGYEVLVDYEKLRSSERWEEALKRMIDQADIFQLYWSANSAESKHVKDEWQYALSKNKLTQGIGFIRPVYWQEPIPKIPSSLEHIHFKYMPSLSESGA